MNQLSSRHPLRNRKPRTSWVSVDPELRADGQRRAASAAAAGLGAAIAHDAVIAGTVVGATGAL